jgi:hypothetical protein
MKNSYIKNNFLKIESKELEDLLFLTKMSL